MKKLRIIALLFVISVLTFSCSKDDGGNTDYIAERTLSTNNKVGFKFIANDSGNININTVTITDVDTAQVIFSENNLPIGSDVTFMYDISSNTYTIN